MCLLVVVGCWLVVGRRLLCSCVLCVCCVFVLCVVIVFVVGYYLVVFGHSVLLCLRCDL